MQMNLPGSVMGACSRAWAAGTVTHSLIEATASALAAPPSRNSRADGGTSAAAISCARTTPRAARVAATLAARSAMRSPCSAPRRGDCPLAENRTSFMGGCLPTKRSEEHTSELQSRSDLVCRLLLEKKKKRQHSYVSEQKN